MERIKVGDLVIIIKPPSCPRAKRSANVGEIFRVKTIKAGLRGCAYCGKTHAPWAPAAHDGRGKWVPLYRLKRIPPLSEGDRGFAADDDIFAGDDTEREVRRRAGDSYEPALAGSLLRTIRRSGKVLATGEDWCKRNPDYMPAPAETFLMILRNCDYPSLVALVERIERPV